MIKTKEFFLKTEDETLAFGERLAQLMSSNAQTSLVIYLVGELGAGKTTLVRGLLKGLGHTGSTKSPTYTLVEPYQLESLSVYHFDLYRLADPEELEFIGIREYQHSNSLLIFEWPDKGQGMIPDADLLIELDYLGNSRQLKLKDFNDKLLGDWNFGDILCQNES